MRHVLLIEDNPDEQLLFKAACRSSGVSWRISVAASHDELKSMLKSDAFGSANEGNWPELVLLDLNLGTVCALPVLDTLRAASATASTPVVTLSGSSDPVVKKAALDRGAQGSLEKPYDICGLVELIRHLDRHYRAA